MTSEKLSYPKEKIKIVLMEKIHEAARETLEEAGYKATIRPSAAQGDELTEILADAHVIGVRSRTHLREAQLAAAKRLLVVGCFSVGTDQVDLDSARAGGIPVFNAPHSSTRSVAELTLANIFSLSRRVAQRSAEMHQGVWEKSAIGSYQVRDKSIGIIGYGHIGQQIGLLAEAVGMNVFFYDVVKKLPLGRARAVESQAELLAMSDYVSLHVPGGESNENLIGSAELNQMRDGSYLLNLSRGKVVDLDALAAALSSGKLAGAALDVYPKEPGGNTDDFGCALKGLPNVIMTPHIGGSTEEAQRNIGQEVAHSIINFLDNGSTMGAVGFPVCAPPFFSGVTSNTQRAQKPSRRA